MKRSPTTIVFLAFALAATSTTAATAEGPPGEPDGAAVRQSTSDRPQSNALDTGVLRDDRLHGGADGHLPPVSKNVQVVGRAPISDRAPGRAADVTVFGDYAYLAAYYEPACEDTGVAVFDISRPSKPRQVDFIPTGPGSFVGEGMQVVRLDTQKFTGDVLIFNNEVCGEPEAGTVGGATLVDVSNPRKWKYLAQGFGDETPPGVAGPDIAHQVHSAFAWQYRGKAYAVLVDDEEAADVDIFDITNPKRPTKVAEHDLAALFPQILQPELEEVFLHDMIVKKIDGRPVMLLSYWDAGYIKLDVTNPRKPVFLGDSDFNNPDPELLAQTGLEAPPEGNAHQAEFTKNNRFVVGADEDFNPFALEGETDDGDTFDAVGGSDTPAIVPDEPLTGTAVYVGRACDADAAVPPAPAGDGPWLAVAERGVCTFDEKVANIEAAGGYDGIIIFNREGEDGCGLFGMTVTGDLPAIAISREAGFALFDIQDQFDEDQCLAGTGEELAPLDLGATGDEVTVSVLFNGWGYIHLFDNRRGDLVELDTFAVREAMDPDFATGFGDLSVHEVATSKMHNELVYVSYYDAGFRVLKIENRKLTEVGAYVGPKGNDFWGVEVFRHKGRELVAASDRDFGLYIFRYTGRPSTAP